MIVFSEMLPANQSYIPAPEQHGSRVAVFHPEVARRKYASEYSTVSDCSCSQLPSNSDYSSLSCVSFQFSRVVLDNIVLKADPARGHCQTPLALRKGLLAL